MLEIIALIFLTKRIGLKAATKGLKPGQWKLFTVVAWIMAEIIGMVIGMTLFGNELVPLILFALFCAFGGYLLVHFILSNKPDVDQREREPGDLL